MGKTPAIAYDAPPAGSGGQDSLPGRYRGWVMGISMAAFALAFAGWLNEAWLFLYESPIWLNRYTEYAIILGFGLWRIRAEKNPYTRKRLMILVAVVTGIWWLIPWLWPVFEPHLGYAWSRPVFPALHTPGTLSFLLVLLLVFLFGRRIICGFGCPCVGIRETVGFAFRHRTIRGQWAWTLRHSKWFFFVWYVGVMAVTQFPPNAWSASLVGAFGLVVGLTYFGSFFLVPLTGNRFYCRYLCPFGATFGLLNHAGFYGIEMERGRCIDCRRCEQVCDMGIPVWRQGRDHGRVTGLEDCMGCARCVISCPTNALQIRDVRNLIRPALRQDGAHLLKREALPARPRLEPELRPANERRGDWAGAERPLSDAAIREQAGRCLDCGVPGCRSACPLGNRIPQWLEAAARGDWARAGELVEATSPLPEVCGQICPQHRLCEGACARARLEGAVSIGALEHALAERALNDGGSASRPARTQGRPMAVIGAGPAGLACADRLNRAGMEVHLYDREPGIGGLLRTAVPSFKLDKSLLERRQTLLGQAGVRFHLGTAVDGGLMCELLEGYDAVFLGLGAQRPRSIELPGQTLPGVVQALDWLARVIPPSQPSPGQGERVLVLGGGDTAMDCARAALRLGAEVTVAYRGPAERLRASPKEMRLAREEGALFLFDHRPLGFVGAGLKPARTKPARTNLRMAVHPVGDAGLRQALFETPQGQRAIDCGLAILALGQQPAPPPWLAGFGIALEDDGRIRVDDRGRTTHPRVWAGGDNTLGPDLAVTAMAAGRRAAEGMLSTSSFWKRKGRRG
ncbi:MAG: FAD-dependent oxidoreductase [Gammaproteobacteria bacterium]|nr:FAD-dependent oxidoreductase [Gammaproteobacteria bacterium]MBU1654945.1 FAD-dependent oxidoreductase [Gammaproteobacteria bacterium]MBU1960497.1 FAD-dependent oxidoreductase [Gammaproteobacteria bacterium]